LLLPISTLSLEFPANTKLFLPLASRTTTVTIFGAQLGAQLGAQFESLKKRKKVTSELQMIKLRCCQDHRGSLNTPQRFHF
jgi:hypothetical protein